MGFFSSLIADIKKAAQGAADGSASKIDLESKISKLRSLQSSMDFQWRKLEADWKKSSSVEENLKRTPLMRAHSLRRAKSIAQRMAVIGKFSNMVETLLGVLEHSERLREHSDQMKAAIGDAAQFKELGSEMTGLMAQNQELLKGISKIQMEIDTFQEQMDAGITSEADKAEAGRLNELYEKLETLQVKGDTAGAKAVEAEIKALVSGGSSLAFA